MISNFSKRYFSLKFPKLTSLTDVKTIKSIRLPSDDIGNLLKNYKINLKNMCKKGTLQKLKKNF